MKTLNKKIETLRKAAEETLQSKRDQLRSDYFAQLSRDRLEYLAFGKPTDKEFDEVHAEIEAFIQAGLNKK